jgi:alkylation response protein AidB-like acyl-CoA dehydrogenase
MRLSCLCCAVVLAGLAVPAAAQTLAPVAAPSLPGVRLPTPEVDEDAPPSAFLNAARLAIAAGRDGEALEALERAESRALDRSVRPSRAGVPSPQPLVARIAQARAALAGGDRMQTLQLIDQALAIMAARQP